MEIPSLTFVILACNLNVSTPDENSPGCKLFKEKINEEVNVGINPMTCMMSSPIRLAKFAEDHPGLLIKKWTCKYLKEEKGA